MSVIDLCLLTVYDKQGPKGSKKPVDWPEPDDNPIYQMTLMIPQVFLQPMQVSRDATIFGVYNDNVSLYIKHQDLGEIAHGGQCLSVTVIQL